MTDIEEIIFAADMYVERAASAHPDRITRESGEAEIDRLGNHFAKMYGETIGGPQDELYKIGKIYFMFSKWMLDKAVYEIPTDFFEIMQEHKDLRISSEMVKELDRKCIFLPIRKYGVTGVFVYTEVLQNNDVDFHILDVCGIQGKMMDMGDAMLRVNEGVPLKDCINNWLASINHETKREDTDKHYKVVGKLLQLIVQSTCLIGSHCIDFREVKVPKSKRLKTSKGKVLNIHYFVEL